MSKGMYYGKPPEDYSKDELIDILVESWARHRHDVAFEREQRERWIKLAELNSEQEQSKGFLDWMFRR